MDKNMAAFPNYEQMNNMQYRPIGGMTLHQYYAGMALQTIKLNYELLPLAGANYYKDIANKSLLIADAMIEAYEKRDSK